jgi:hypothetical protein
MVYPTYIVPAYADRTSGDYDYKSPMLTLCGGDISATHGETLAIPPGAPSSESDWDNLFAGYDCVIWLTSSTYNYNPTTDFKNSLFNYIDNGGGLFLLSDHSDFQSAANKVVMQFGIQFYGTITRDGALDAYKVSTILGNSEYIRGGWHALFDRIPITSSLFAGESEGKMKYDNTYGVTLNDVTDTSGEVTFDITGKSGQIIVRDSNDCGVVIPA